MVHALKQAHRMLQPDGVLISAHYLAMPHLIEVHSPAAVRKMGWILDRNGFADELSSSNALAQVVADRYYSLQDELDFVYPFYADNLTEYQAWMTDYWSSIYLPDTTYQQLEEYLRAAGPSAKIVLAMRARMTKLKVQ
jgi:hypothetical protein